MGTNAYEVIVGIRERVPRIYFRDGELVAARVSVDAATAIQSKYEQNCRSSPARKAPRRLASDYQYRDARQRCGRSCRRVRN